MSKTPLRCKLEINGKSVQQEMKFKYLGIEISGYRDIETEVRRQAMKAARKAACLNNTIWSNKHMGIETKSRIYKAETSKTKQILETTEIKVVRKIHTDDRIVKTSRDKSPAGQRSTGRPRKRWSDNLPVN